MGGFCEFPLSPTPYPGTPQYVGGVLKSTVARTVLSSRRHKDIATEILTKNREMSSR